MPLGIDVLFVEEKLSVVEDSLIHVLELDEQGVFETSFCGQSGLDCLLDPRRSGLGSSGFLSPWFGQLFAKFGARQVVSMAGLQGVDQMKLRVLAEVRCMRESDHWSRETVAQVS